MRPGLPSGLMSSEGRALDRTQVQLGEMAVRLRDRTGEELYAGLHDLGRHGVIDLAFRAAYHIPEAEEVIRAHQQQRVPLSDPACTSLPLPRWLWSPT